MTTSNPSGERRPITNSRVWGVALRRSGIERVQHAYDDGRAWPGVGSLLGYQVSHPEVNWYGAGHSEAHMTRVCERLIKTGWTTVDVGANKGAETLAIPSMMRMAGESRPFTLLEFHNPEAWETRRLLLATGYRLYDVARERWVEPSEERVHQVLAVPAERAGLLGA